MTDLTAVRGDTNVFDLTITAPVAGVATPVNLAGGLLWFTVLRDWDDSDAEAIVQKTIGAGIVVTNAAGGLATVTLDPADTEDLVGLHRLVYDVQLKESDGTVTTVASGYLSVVRDATKATA